MSQPTEMWPLPPEQEARAQAKMEASDVPAYDWPDARRSVREADEARLARSHAARRARGSLGRGGQRKSWPADQWRTLCRDGRVR